MFRFSRHSLLTSLTLMASLSWATFTSAQSVYVSGAGNEFGTVDLTTGLFTPIGTTGTTSDQLTGLTFTPNGTLYGVNLTADTLYTIDTTTGALTTVSTLTGITGSDSGLTAAPDGTLFLMDTTSTLYTIDPGTGVATPVGPVGNVSSGTIAFMGNNLYETNNELSANLSGTDVLNLLDQSAGAGTPIGAGTGVQFILGMANVNGTLYGFDNLNEMVTLDTTLGLASFQGSYALPNGDNIYAAAFLPPVTVPEPSSVALVLSMTLAGAGFLARRKNTRQAA